LANLNVQLAGANLQVIDNSASIQRVNSPLVTVVAQTSASFYDPYFLVANPGPAAITLPAATVWVVAIRNISGANNISITLTPAGGSAWVSPYVLVPNGVFITMATFASNPGSGGFTALSLGASGANTFCELLLAA
jgi:hypothetical protein